MSAPAAAPVLVPLIPGIEQASGPLIVGFMLHWGLFGTLTIQVYLYYMAFPRDPMWSKILVYSVYAIEFAQTIIIAHDAFADFGYGFGDITALTNIHLDWLAVPIMAGLVALVGQSFYAFRVHVLSKSIVLPLVIMVVALMSFVAACITGAFSLIEQDITRMNNARTSIALGLWCGGGAFCDILIAVCMTYNLLRNDTGYARTRVLISKLIRLTIETGTVTALCAVAYAGLFLGYPGKAFYVTPALLMPKLYANTILVVLNSRMRIDGGRAEITDLTSNIGSGVGSGVTSTIRMTTPMNVSKMNDGVRSRPMIPMVAIQTEVYQEDEREDKKGLHAY